MRINLFLLFCAVFGCGTRLEQFKNPQNMMETGSCLGHALKGIAAPVQVSSTHVQKTL